VLILTLGVERIAEWSSAWMHSNSNRLRLNSENRSFFGAQLADDVFNLTPWGQRQLNVCGSLIPPVTVVRDLLVILQSDLAVKDHVARTVSHCFGQLRQLKGCIKYLPFEAARAAQVDRCNTV